MASQNRPPATGLPERGCNVSGFLTSPEDQRRISSRLARRSRAAVGSGIMGLVLSWVREITIYGRGAKRFPGSRGGGTVNDFDRAARYAVKNGPEETRRWLYPRMTPSLRFHR